MWKYHGIIFFGMVLETILGCFYDKMNGAHPCHTYIYIYIYIYTQYIHDYTLHMYAIFIYPSPYLLGTKVPNTYQNIPSSYFPVSISVYEVCGKNNRNMVG